MLWNWSQDGARTGIALKTFKTLGTSSLLIAIGLLASEAAAARQQQQQQQPYYGSLIGKLNGRSHNVSGEVYAVDEQTLFIKDFSYDGQAQDAYFWSSGTDQRAGDKDGFIVPDEKGSTKPLERYVAKDIVLRLPEGKTLREIHWLGVWSRATKQSSGDITIGRQVQAPRPLEIGPLSQLAHGLKSGPITIVDAQTFLVPDFHYDGLGPEAYFWLTRGSSGLGPSGLKLKDENGGAGPLRKYSGETVVISLPDELTIHDFDYFGVWCTKFQVNFGQVRIPQAARVPPSPKMLGIKPENKLNCEILYDELGYEIRWVLDGDDIVMQLVGKIEPGEYMAFGLGKDDSKSDMQNADAVAAWVDRSSGQVHAVDYYLGAKQQCAAPAGTCPDSKLPGGGDSLTLLHGAIVNGYSMVTFKRPQLGVDDQYDQHVYSDGQQSVLWAIGTLNKQQEIGYHRLKTRSNMFIDFARNPQWNCPIPDLNATMHTNNLPQASASQLDPTVVSAAPVEQQVAKPALADWFIPSLVCPQERTFYVQLGPTGGRKGYEARTGRQGWGLAWYVNGIMIPELVVERGLSYRFVVEGGSDKTSAARRHPFYLTDSQEGGFDFKTDDERLKERIFAGVALRGDGQFVPTAEGRLCEWRPTEPGADPDSFATFAAYQRSLKLDCAPGQPAILKFTPDANTPDQLYYQCYTHRFMGWRVRVVDSCTDYLRQQQDLGPPANPGAQNATASGGRTRKQPAYERRLATDDDLMVAASAPLINRLLVRQVRNMAQQRQGMFDFGDEALASTTELSSFPSDMLILNSSVLNQRQPFNMSTIEQILRLSPSDLEFIGGQTEEDGLFHAVPFAHLQHLNGGVAGFHHRPARPTQTKKAKKSNKQPAASWNSYIRRLASIYYPLTSMLSSNGGGGQQVAQASASHSVQQAPTEQVVSSFSLSNLVPKPKIDLTKSGITKKLNKLRFKSGGEQKQQQQHQAKPPTPAIEFNYDIFNNQLAQLEKQQKQLESMELLSWAGPPPPPVQHQQAVDPFNYMPMVSAASAEQQTFGQPLMFADSNLSFPPNQMQSHQMQTIRVQVPPHQGPAFRNHPNRNRQQPQFQAPVGRPMGQQQQSWLSEQQQQQDQAPVVQQEQSVYVARVPQFSSYTPKSQPDANQQHISARYPNIQPYNGLGQQQMQMQQQQYPPNHQTHPSRPSGNRDEQVQHQMSSLPSVALTIHDAPNRDEVESLSGSGSGSQYELRQPVKMVQAESGEQASRGGDTDYMMAIERFSSSKQQANEPTSHREQLRYGTNELAASASQHQQSATSAPVITNSTSINQPRRFSNLLTDKNTMAPSEPTPADIRQRVQVVTPSRPQPELSTTPYATVTESTRPTTSEPASSTTLRLSQDLFGATAPSVGPLVPSLGPPPMSQHQPLANSETVLKSTLVEPISSTLTPPNLIHVDSNPFTPLIYQHHLPSRFGPSVLVESMFRHQEQPQLSTFTPPVQVASYLAQQLASDGAKNDNSNRSSASSELIILKPSLLAQHNPQTYALRPEHYTTNTLQAVGNELLANSATAEVHMQDGPTRRIAGRQFDRLSSLSSPPSTSIALEPVQQASNNSRMSSHQKHSTGDARQQLLGRPGSQSAAGDNSRRSNEASPSQQQTETKSEDSLKVDESKQQQQHRQTSTTSKQIPLNYDPMEQSHHHNLISLDDGFRPNPGGESTSAQFYRNNQTDNAILSHVMSLISSNAIPAPPLVPVASYSSADYFLPVSDRNQRSLRG